MPSKFGDHAQAVADGVLEAWRTYGGWSQNFYVHDEGIEAFLSAKIAETLHARFADSFRVQLEAPVEKLKAASGCMLTPGRYPQALRRAGRVDVAFSDSKGRPIGAVEVKRHLQASGHRADLMRLCAMLNRFGREGGGSMRWAALAAMHTIWASNSDGTDARLERAAATYAPTRQRSGLPPSRLRTGSLRRLSMSVTSCTARQVCAS